MNKLEASPIKRGNPTVPRDQITSHQGWYKAKDNGYDDVRVSSYTSMKHNCLLTHVQERGHMPMDYYKPSNFSLAFKQSVSNST